MAPIDQLEVSWAFVQSREQPLSTAGEVLKNVLRETVQSRVACGDWTGAKLVA